MAKGKRTRLEPNIYQYPNGRYEILVSVTGLPPRREQFAPNTSRAHLRARVMAARAEMEDEVRAFGAVPASDRVEAIGTLEGDAPSYLKQIAGRASSKADGSHLRAWFEVVVDGVRLGSLARSAWTVNQVNQAIAQWQTTPTAHAIRKIRVGGYARDAVTVEGFTIAATTVRTHDRGGPQAATIQGYERKGSTIAPHARQAHTVPGYVRTAPATSGAVVAALTIRHRCRVLQDLWHTLDGKRAPTPVDEAKIPKRPKTPPGVVPAETVIAVLETLARTDVQTFARFYVHATTGQRPCQIGRARPIDLQLEQKIWLVRNAKGEPAHCIVLNPQQVAAWTAFVSADAWGSFDTSKYGRLVHAAGWPKGVKPYNARHSLAVDAIRRGISLGDVQALLGHADPSTTRIYAPFQIDRQRVVSDLMTPYLAAVLKPRLVAAPTSGAHVGSKVGAKKGAKSATPNAVNANKTREPRGA